MIWVSVYVLSIMLVNWLFVVLPIIQTPWGGWSAANILVGFVFVFRDLAQRKWGHWVLGATACGGILTWFVVQWLTPADSFIKAHDLALASVTAFLVSEMVDWAVYTWTKKPLQGRILWSTALSSPVDTLIFLKMIGFLTLPAFILETCSKIVGGFVVWWLIRRRVE